MKNHFGAVMSMLLGVILILAFGLELQSRIGKLKDFCSSKEVLTLTADYVSSEKITEIDEDGSSTHYRITRQCIVHGEPLTYTSDEKHDTTAPVSVVVYLGRDGSYHFRKNSNISGDVCKAVLNGIALLLGGGFILAGLRELFRKKTPEPDRPADSQ